MYEVKSDICFFVAMRPKKSSGGETLLQKKQMSVCLFAEKMCPQKQDYLQGDIIDGDRHRPAAGKSQTESGADARRISEEKEKL